VRQEEWRVLAEMDASGGLHFVFAREAIRLHPPWGSMATTDDLSEERLRELFLTSYREIWYEDSAGHVSLHQSVGAGGHADGSGAERRRPAVKRGS
jgi:hypothetical protein